jgi:hypothetical protein
MSSPSEAGKRCRSSPFLFMAETAPPGSVMLFKEAHLESARRGTQRAVT